MSSADDLLARVRGLLLAAGLDVAEGQSTAAGLYLTATGSAVAVTWRPTAEPTLNRAVSLFNASRPLPGIREALRAAVTETLTAAALRVIDDPAAGVLTVHDPLGET